MDNEQGDLHPVPVSRPVGTDFRRATIARRLRFETAQNHLRPTMPCAILPRSFFSRPPDVVARELLGTTLVTRVDGKRTSGRIVETEAYLASGDPACHASRGRTRSNASMFGRPGTAYVYPIHSRYCFNIVTGAEGEPCAVLIRALEPLEGIAVMERRRGLADQRRLTTGPACLCQAMGIDRSHDGLDLVRRRTIWLERPGDYRPPEPSGIRITPRIGVTSAHDARLRYVIANHPFASGPKKWR